MLCLAILHSDNFGARHGFSLGYCMALVNHADFYVYSSLQSHLSRLRSVDARGTKTNNHQHNTNLFRSAMRPVKAVGKASCMTRSSFPVPAIVHSIETPLPITIAFLRKHDLFLPLTAVTLGVVPRALIAVCARQ